jgi:hypothetical protein
VENAQFRGSGTGKGTTSVVPKEGKRVEQAFQAASKMPEDERASAPEVRSRFESGHDFSRAASPFIQPRNPWCRTRCPQGQEITKRC